MHCDSRYGLYHRPLLPSAHSRKNAQRRRKKPNAGHFLTATALQTKQASSRVDFALSFSKRPRRFFWILAAAAAAGACEKRVHGLFSCLTLAAIILWSDHRLVLVRGAFVPARVPGAKRKKFGVDEKK